MRPVQGRHGERRRQDDPPAGAHRAPRKPFRRPRRIFGLARRAGLEIGERDEQARAHHGLGQAHHALGDHVRARRRVDRARYRAPSSAGHRGDVRRVGRGRRPAAP
ncbi:hypothetical protein ABGB18_04330 [Nonomuraea sp. B12E4]|uniref:hypothetical protein n=1 Tax=Nonomuraea sp. B12E4 TaxID=3153564 RepID=UPI00325EC636